MGKSSSISHRSGKSYSRAIDISVTVQTGMPSWPGESEVRFERIKRIEDDGVNTTLLKCSTHCGTHVDAQIHFISLGLTAESIPIELCIGETFVCNVSKDVNLITADLLETLRIPESVERLIFKTRNSDLWQNPTHTFVENYVALSEDAASWIVGKNIKLVGIDYLSIQCFLAQNSRVHEILLKEGVLVLEGLDLRGVEEGNYFLICLPIKLAGSDGAPVRAVLLEE